MSEYYGVVRAPNYLSHALERGSGGVAVYNNHKYIARAMTSSGKYRYFYDSVELAAYKNQRTKQTNSLTKLSDSPAGPASSQSKSLREKWEERRGLLGSQGGSGSGGSGGGRGGGSGKRSGGSSGGRSAKAKGSSSSSKGTVIKAVKPQEGPKHYGHLSSGALKYQGDSTPNNEQTTQTKKKKKQTTQTKKKQPRLRQIVTMRGGVPTVTVRRDYRR